MKRRGRPAKHRRARLSILCVAMCLFAVAPVFAQSISARSTTSETYVGEPFRVQVSVTNPTTATTPAPGTSEAVTIKLDQTVQNPTVSQMYQNINGRESRQVTYTYTFEVRASQLGVVLIPPFEVNDGGRMLRSEPIRITVKKPSSSSELFCRVNGGKRNRVYVGERLGLTLEIWIKKYRQEGFELGARETFQLVDENRSAFGVFAPGNNPTYREDTRVDEQGRRSAYYVYMLEAAMYPTKPGPLNLDDVVIAVEYPVRLGRDVFGRLYHDGNPRRLSQSPEMPSLEVVALPLEGRPPDFNGAVGTYSLSASAKPVEVAVGDPITLNLSIRGNGPLDRLSAPRLGEVKALTKDFEVSGESPAGEVEAGTKTFSITLRPLREDLQEIPPLPLSYFDPAKENYATSHSEAIPIKVRAAVRLSLPAQGNGATPATGVLAPFEESDAGLLANEADPAHVLFSDSGIAGPIAPVILAVMPLITCAAWMIRRRQMRAGRFDAARRRSRALRTAKARLGGTWSAREARATLLGYIADRCDRAAAGMTRTDAVQLMSSDVVPQGLVQRLDSMLEEIERAEFGAEGSTPGPEQVGAILEELERCRS